MATAGSSNAEVIDVVCGNITAQLHTAPRLGSGDKGRCIKLGNQWMTPMAFETYCERGASKNWKRSIKVQNKTLREYLKNRCIFVHNPRCTCQICIDGIDQDAAAVEAQEVAVLQPAGSSDSKSGTSDIRGETTDYKKLYEQVLLANDSLREELRDTQQMLERYAVENDTLKRDLNIYKSALEQHDKDRRALHNQLINVKGSIRVFCRVRPSLADEDIKFEYITYLDEQSLEIRKGVSCTSGQRFSFDKVFPPEATQGEVFEELSQLVQSALDGYHVCVFAYGQTGSGKTYTMQGEKDEDKAGIIPRAIKFIFDRIANQQKVGWSYKVEASFLEIYNDTVHDLLDQKSGKNLEINFNEGKGTTVKNLLIKSVHSAAELHQLMEEANRNRAVASTNCNERSSRSHAVTKIVLTGENQGMKVMYVGSLNLVDLAGSESAKTSTTEHMVETKHINKSLSTLGAVMTALRKKDSHIPYRDSQLTYLLQSCLGGNCKTLMFVNIAPLEECYRESVNALRFAEQSKEVKMGASRNKKNLPPKKINFCTSSGGSH